MPDISKLGLPEDVRPWWHGQDGVPRCGQEPASEPRGCPSYDGKRCAVLGHRPDYICEPAVEAMASTIPGFLEASQPESESRASMPGKEGK